uniref:DUF834 domain-containing protein n=1 Tax=Oryza meridionalis TaxID=40149 RepID=A0A0E0ESD5_9ORYZ
MAAVRELTGALPLPAGDEGVEGGDGLTGSLHSRRWLDNELGCARAAEGGGNRSTVPLLSPRGGGSRRPRRWLDNKLGGTRAAKGGGDDRSMVPWRLGTWRRIEETEAVAEGDAKLDNGSTGARLPPMTSLSS